jgi:AraC-like DNA-binding protein/ligand-binding sensor protein
MMNAFEQLAAMPALRRLSDLVWRTFGVNTGIVSMDGRQMLSFDKAERAQPFCGALQKRPGGAELCTLCDRSKFLEARREPQILSYRCHAGLREFIIPIIRNGQPIALLQCGQVHDRSPTMTEWRNVRASLQQAGIRGASLGAAFRRNRVLGSGQQRDLLTLLELVAARLAQADERELRPASGETQVELGRAFTYIEAHLAERLSVADVARATGLSSRSLMRRFRSEIGTSVVEFILNRRMSRARELLRQTDRSCAEIAFECGFGSVQHFNRVFRRFQGTTPTRWRKSAANVVSTAG